MRVSLVAFAVVPTMLWGAAQAQGLTRAFGHSVSVSVPSPQGQSVLRVDGRALLALGRIRLDEAGVLNGAGFVVGYASEPGTACDEAPFLLSFSASGKPRVDGPVAGCGARVEIGADRVRLLAAPGPDGQAETWDWTHEAGLVRGTPMRRTASAESGWDRLRERGIDRPAQLMDYPDTAGAIREAAGPDLAAVLPILTGTGAGRVSGTAFEGESCRIGDCLTNGMFLYADIPSRKVYMAWRDAGTFRTTSAPAVGEWPEEGRRLWLGWSAREAAGR